MKRYLRDVQKGVVPRTVWPYTEVGHTDGARKLLKEIFHDQDVLFDNPKALGLLERVLSIGADKSALILDSFAGSGTTAHAVLALNKYDGGERRFILVECEDYANSTTAERIRRVIRGYEFAGTQKTELMRETLTWTRLKNQGGLIDQVNSIENMNGHEYDRISKRVANGELIVTGETRVQKRTEGLGGSFTYCTLGEPVSVDKILTGDTLPPYEGIGAMLFHMATNQVLSSEGVRETDFYLGAAGNRHIWLIYKPDLDWLKSPEAALTLTRAREIASYDHDKHHLVFAPARYVSQRMLAEQRIPVEFVPLPFSLYRIAQN